MPRRYRRALFKRPINSVKNIVDTTSLATAGGTTADVDLATVVNDYTGTANTVPIGAKIAGIYLFVQILNTTTIGNVDWYVIKTDGNTIAAAPTPGTTGGNNVRRWILHEEKGIPGSVTATGSGPLTFRGVIKIPRGRQRMGDNDFIRLRLRSSNEYMYCVKCIYKWYQ